MSNLASNHIHHSAGASSFVGAGAVNVYRLIVLKSSISLFLKTGMKPTRGVGITQMLALAGEATGKKYKRSEGEKAMADLQLVIEAARSAIPETSHTEMEGA